ncbi:DUF72 domain-containing protein [Candidatus Bathyarchaeota archaeon]|nr:DUF72 domain-containing protein [Candidatus Bathyarchaeota archaeon]
MELLIGAGGWAYFNVAEFKSLEAYAEAFNFVEVNSTFYEIPSMNLVKSWRSRVPRDFEFAVRCYKDVTHTYHMEPTEEAIKTFNTMAEICRVLKAKFLVLETPAKIQFDENKVDAARSLLENVDFQGIKLVWEVRRNIGDKLPHSLVKLMSDKGIVHCVDLSKENPAVESNVLYTRLFGKGQHNVYQFTDEELGEIDQKIAKSNSSTTAISFHKSRGTLLLQGIKLVWEVRRNIGDKLPHSLVKLMSDKGIVHCVDLSKENPAVESNVLYTRLFGKGQHNVYQFTDEELGEIDQKIAKSNSSTTAISFHNVKMFTDAARFKIFKETGRFATATKATGQQSLREVLVEDASFPMTKQELINKQGWKMIDLTENKRVHASTLLEKLPNKTFRNIEEVLVSLQHSNL